MAWAGFLSPLIMIGLPGAVVRMRPDCETEEQWERFVQSVALVLIATSLVFLGASSVIGERAWLFLTSGEIQYWPLVPITLVAVALGALARLALAVYQAEQKAWMVMLFEQALSIGVIIWALVLVFVFDLGVVGYMTGGLVGAASVSAIFGIKLLKQKASFVFEKSLIAGALAYGLPLVPQAVAAWTLNLSDRVMLERFSGLSQAGLYNLAANFAVVISMAAISINQAILPRYLRKAKEEFNCLRERREGLKNIALPGFVALAFLISMAVAFGPWALGLMVNERYLPALPLVVPVLGGSFFFGIGQFMLLPLFFQKKTRLIASITIIGAIVNLILNYLFIPEHGAVAAAYTTLASYVLTFVMAYFAARRSDWMGIKGVEVLAICGGALVAIGICWWKDGAAIEEWVIRLLVCGLVAGLFLLWFVKLVRPGTAS